MGSNETEAIVLRTYNLAEADKIVVCLTRCCGVVRGVAHGARRLKSRFGAALEPFTQITLHYFEKEGRELVSIKQADIDNSLFGRAREAETVAALTYICELVMEFAPPHEPNETLFRLTEASLQAVAQTPSDSDALKRYFELWMLKIAGFLPEIRDCAECRRGLADTGGSYLNGEGRMRCAVCSKKNGLLLSADARTQIANARRFAPPKFAAEWIKATNEARAETTIFTERLIERALEKVPRTGDVFTARWRTIT